VVRSFRITMAIAFDAQGSGNATGTSDSWNHTCTGSNRCLVVAAIVDTSRTITSVTYNGVGMTQAITKPWNPNTTQNIYLFYLIAPATGTNTITVNASASCNIFGVSASYTGVSQSFTPDTGFYSGNDPAGNYTATVNVTTANSWLVESVWPADAVETSVVNGVARQAGPANPNIADSNGTVGSGNQTIGYGWSAPDRHIIVAMSIPPVPVTTATPTFMLVGVGTV